MFSHSTLIAAPRLRGAAISGLYWALVTLIDVSLWLMNTTRQFFARDAHVIALDAFAHAHEPLPDFLALPPAAVPMALPFSSFFTDDSVQRWLTSALPLLLSPWVANVAVPVSPAVAPVVKKTRKSEATDTKIEKTLTDKTPRKRSPKTATATAQ